MNSEFGDSASASAEPSSDSPTYRAARPGYGRTAAPAPSRPSRRGVVMLLVMIAFAAGMVMAVLGTPTIEKWWQGKGDESGAIDNAVQPLMDEELGAGDRARNRNEASPAATSLSVATLEARMAAVSAKLDAVSAQADGAGGNAARAEGLLIAFATRRTLDRGSPLGYLEGELRLRFGETQPRAVTTIINAANSPVTLADLQAGLDEVAPKLIGAGGKDGWWSATKRELAHLIVIRKANEPSPVPQKALERARLMLSAERVDNAVEEIERLPDHQDADEWLQMARKYNEARRALDVIEAAAILEPRTVPAGRRSASQSNMQVAPPPPAVPTIAPEQKAQP